MTLDKAKRITIFFMVTATVIILGYDAFIVWQTNTDASISWTFWTYAKKYPVIPFAWGVLSGHLFWTQEKA